MEENFLKRYQGFYIGLGFLVWAILVNRFPGGHIFIGGDVYQLTNLQDQFPALHFGWFSGRVSLFYAFFLLLQKIGISPAAQLSWYLGVFLIGAYISFWLFSRLIFSKLNEWWAMAVAIFYATNVYTLYIFTASWGFTSYQILYVFIPVLVGFYIKVLTESKASHWGWFFFVVSLASMSFSNPAFAVSLGLMFLLLTALLLWAGVVPFSSIFFRRVILVCIGGVLLNAYWLLPLLPQARAGVAEISASTDIVLGEALRKTSNSVMDTVRLLQTHEQGKYYPANFPYPSIAFLKPIVFLMAFVPFLLAMGGLLIRQSKETRRLQWVMVGIWLLFGILMMKARFPFETMNSFLFQLPVLNALRGWDKLAIYTPFFVSTLLLMFFSSDLLKERKWALISGGVFGCTLLILALPFYAGGLQTDLSYILAQSKKKDYEQARQSTLIRIPDPYYAAQGIFDADRTESRISMLPYSPGSSIGRVDLPKLKINGPHPANALYGKRYIELSDYYIAKWIFAKEFSRSDIQPDWIVDLFGLLEIKYVFYHHDAKQKALDAFEPQRQYLEERGLLVRQMQNEWFTLYEIPKQWLFPYVYTSPTPITLELNPEKVSERVQELRKDAVSLSYEKKSFKEFTVTADVMLSNQVLYLNERMDPLWRAELVQEDGSVTPLSRVDTVLYANAWKIPSLSKDGVIHIHYFPNQLLWVGEWISGVAFLGVIGWGVYSLRRNRLKEKQYVNCSE